MTIPACIILCPKICSCCLRDEVTTFLCGFVRQCAHACICVCVWVWLVCVFKYAAAAEAKTRRAPLFCFPLFKTVTRPRCRINDCDKKGRLPLGHCYETHSQNTPSPERDACLPASRSAVRPTQAGSDAAVLFYGCFGHRAHCCSSAET